MDLTIERLKEWLEGCYFVKIVYEGKQDGWHYYHFDYFGLTFELVYSDKSKILEVNVIDDLDMEYIGLFDFGSKEYRTTQNALRSMLKLVRYMWESRRRYE